MEPLYVARRNLKWADVDLPEEYWWVDVGPFYDRFATHGGLALKVAILSAQTPYSVAARADSAVRKYIDLKRHDLPAILGGIATEVGGLTQEIIGKVLSTKTSEYERHIKGLVEPNDH